MGNILANISKKNIIISIAVILLITGVLISISVIMNLRNKPDEYKAKRRVEDYIIAMTNGDGQKMYDTIDAEGYIIFKQSGEKNFDEDYNKKSQIIEEYLKKNEFSDMELASQRLKSDFEKVYGYYKYRLNEIVSVENSEQSKNIIVVRCKVQLESSRYSAVNAAKFYILKNNGDYKIIGMEM